MPVKTVTSPSSAPQVTFGQATRGVSKWAVKQDTWHVSKRIFWYMHLYTFLPLVCGMIAILISIFK